MHRPLLILAALLLLAGVGAAWLSRPLLSLGEPMTYTADSIGPPESGAAIEIWRPDPQRWGPGPYPAIVLMHGAGGAGSGEWQWARRLNGLGYVAVILDSYRPRCGRMRCSRSTVHSPVSTPVRAGDLTNLLAVLRHQPGIDGNRLAAIGFSQGGGAALIAAADDRGRPPLLRAVVSYYSSCRLPPGTRLPVDTIALIGKADDIASRERCRDLVVATESGTHPVQVSYYPGVGHNFDREDSDAARRSIAVVEAFLAAHLKAR